MKNMKRVKKRCAVGCCTGWLLACSPAVQSVEELPALIPVPQECTFGDNAFRLTRSTTIGTDAANAELTAIAAYFNGKTESCHGLYTSGAGER